MERKRERGKGRVEESGECKREKEMRLERGKGEGRRVERGGGRREEESGKAGADLGGSGPPLSYMKNDVMHTVIYAAFCMLPSLDLQACTSF